MYEYAPPPWDAIADDPDTYVIYDGEGSLIATVNSDVNEPDIEETYETARVIANVPAMVSALTFCTDRLKRCVGKSGDEDIDFILRASLECVERALYRAPDTE